MTQSITLFVDQLTVIDACYLDQERGLLGESWMVDIELEGKLNYQGMILDFGDIKKQVKQLIDHEFDHKLIVPSKHPSYKLHILDTQCTLEFQLSSGEKIQHTSPPSALCPIDCIQLNQSILEQAIVEKLSKILPSNVEKIHIHLHTEPKSDNQYQYAHGLKQHTGNCQRIAHGHRSYLNIFSNNERDLVLEKAWASQWKDIYIAFEDDLLEKYTDQDLAYYRFSYTSQQGDFSLAIPASRCHLMPTESTVENIAQHIANRLKQQYPDHDFKVKAFEGVRKGAWGQR